MLPEWEFVARILFAIVNKCGERIQTAESDAFYTTFDVILSRQFNEQENKFPRAIGFDHMELLLDLLVLPEGPRLRDKISHGEVSSDDKFVHHGLEIVCASYLDITYLIQNWDDSLNSLDIDSNLTHGYSSQYHPTSLLIENTKIATDMLQQLFENLDLRLLNSMLGLKQEVCLNMIRQDQEFIDTMQCMLRKLYCGGLSKQTENLKKLSVCILQIYDLVSSLLPETGKQCSTEYLSECSHHRNQISNEKVCTLYRSKREYELWSLCEKIIYHINSYGSKVTENLSDRRRHIEDKTLRSRQRTTCKRMLETIPLLNVTYLCLLITILNYLLEFYDNTIVEVDGINFSKTLKKSKKYLKFCENISVNVDISKNRWEESSKMAMDFVHMYKNK